MEARSNTANMWRHECRFALPVLSAGSADADAFALGYGTKAIPTPNAKQQPFSLEALSS